MWQPIVTIAAASVPAAFPGTPQATFVSQLEMLILTNATNAECMVSFVGSAASPPDTLLVPAGQGIVLDNPRIESGISVRYTSAAATTGTFGISRKQKQGYGLA